LFIKHLVKNYAGSNQIGGIHINQLNQIVTIGNRIEVNQISMAPFPEDGPAPIAGVLGTDILITSNQ